MERMHFGMIALLACAAMLAPVQASAQARGASMQDFLAEVRAAGAPENKVPQMDAWLRRLVGRFRYEGTLSITMLSGYLGRVQGIRDCVGIGDGPGVQCVINMTWPDVEQTLSPAMSLFGIDPNRSLIKFLQVDSKGLPEGGDGILRGEVARFIVPCVNSPPTCRRVLKVRASADRRNIDVRMETWGNYYRELEPTLAFDYVLLRTGQ